MLGKKQSVLSPSVLSPVVKVTHFDRRKASAQFRSNLRFHISHGSEDEHSLERIHTFNLKQ